MSLKKPMSLKMHDKFATITSYSPVQSQFEPRWEEEYLTLLYMHHYKSCEMAKMHHIQVGEMSYLNRLDWLLAKVIHTFPDKEVIVCSWDI